MTTNVNTTEHHSESKGDYSLISVDVAPEEEVILVDAAGVHRMSPQDVCADVDSEGLADGDASVDAWDSSKDVHTSASDVLQVSGDVEVEASSAVDSCRDADTNDRADAGVDADKATNASSSTKHDAAAAEDQTLNDLEQPVPFAGMQRTIVILLVILLVAFIIYFAM